jgi:hypothetical protein
MVEAGLKKIEADDMTLTTGLGPASVVITDEAMLPESFWRVKREPNKVAIGEALKGGVTVPGAGRGNQAPVLKVRTS